MILFSIVKAFLAKRKQSNPKAATAGQQDHTNPWVYAGKDKPAPTNPEVTE